MRSQCSGETDRRYLKGCPDIRDGWLAAHHALRHSGLHVGTSRPQRCDFVRQTPTETT